MSERQLIVVDVETTGLDLDRHVILEIAAINVDTGVELHFAPHIEKEAIIGADPIALSINRYYERRVFEQQLNRKDTELKARELHEMLLGNTLAGSNPSFDARALELFFYAQRYANQKPWHHRLADLAAYTAGRFGTPPTEAPGLDKVCELLFILNEEPHSAVGDARATAECFRRLSELRQP